MPQRLQFTIIGPKPRTPYWYSEALSALVYDWIRTVSPDLSGILHEANQIKPFNVGSLQPGQRPNESVFEVAVLSDWLAPIIQEGCAKSAAAITLAQTPFRLNDTGVVVSSDTYHSLMHMSSCATSWVIDVVTPIAHNATGAKRKSVPAPSPELYFGSWHNRWAKCSSVPMPDKIMETVESNVAINAFSGGTVEVPMGKNHSHTGFVGTVQFIILRPHEVDKSHVQALNSLVNFSSYCGTGVLTMRGMGHTRVVKRH